MTTANAFSYSINFTISQSGTLLSITPNYGLIQYQGYMYRQYPIIGQDCIVMMADNLTKLGSITNYFYYQLPLVPKNGSRYPLYDATKAINAPYYNSTAGMIITNPNNVSTLYIVTDQITDSFVGYTISGVYTISTWASHVSSNEVYIIGSDDLWSAKFTIPVQNYSSVFTGMTSLGIILVVFMSLLVLFAIFMVTLKACADRSKRLLKDSHGDEHISTYYKIHDSSHI